MTFKINATERLLAETVDEYTQRLEKLGVKKLGEGMYADVFQHPTMPNVVVKLVPFTDHGYEAYLKFCRRHQNNPYCPKILDVRRKARGFDTKYEGSSPIEYTLIFMEKLRPMTRADYEKFGRFVISQMSDEERRYWKRNSDSHMLNNSSDVWEDVFHNATDPNLKQLAQFLRNPPEPLDMHSGNLMLRGRQVVITDPLS